MIHRECGVLKTSYEADMALYPLPIARWTVGALAVLFFAVLPLTLHEYYLSIGNLVWIAVMPWLAGRVVRRYRIRAGNLERLADRLHDEQEVSGRLAVAEERQRMAAELHDEPAEESERQE